MLNDIILINKPIHWTSFDVVKKIRSIIKKRLKIKKIKVGHAGTLDPLASGLLILCVGDQTKNINEIQKLKKKYLATVKLGFVTESFDREKEEIKKIGIEEIKKEDVIQLESKFLGSILQVPPKYSAIKIDGVRSYQKMRNNQTDFVLSKRKVHIYSFVIKKIEFPYIQIEIICSKGTYIRSVANDIGLVLGCGAYLFDLTRLSIGHYKLKDSLCVNEFKEKYKFN
jgi:tRNA pseudouridine55 synthase